MSGTLHAPVLRNYLDLWWFQRSSYSLVEVFSSLCGESVLDVFEFVVVDSSCVVMLAFNS